MLPPDPQGVGAPRGVRSVVEGAPRRTRERAYDGDVEPGCPACFGQDAARVWEERARLVAVSRLADESHFSVRRLRCGACGQEFVSVFCEQVDWADGNDPQEWLLIPVTEDEARLLAAAGEDGIERALGTLRSPRRQLARSYPRDEARPAVEWRYGPVRLPPHD